MFISGSADGTCRLWSGDATSSTQFRSIGDPLIHAGCIKCLAALPTHNIFASGSSDCTVRLWSIDESDDGETYFGLRQEISLKPRFIPLAISLSELYHPTVGLAVSGTTTAVQLYESSEKDFNHVATLKGYEGWVQSAEFVCDEKESGKEWLLASGCQDKRIRIWRLQEAEKCEDADGNDQKAPSKKLQNKAHRFNSATRKYVVMIDAVLSCHEDWVYTTAWKWTAEKKLQLLSASADNSLAIWEIDERSGVWTIASRLGEISNASGSTTATGSTGGFWLGLWSGDGNAVVCLGRTGGWRLWTSEENTKDWKQRVASTGHAKPVKDIAWDPTGSYILSVSTDQTTRLHSRWTRPTSKSWHELSRPQIHGYDINCIASVTRSQFLSGADEKLLRVFDEPGLVAQLIARFSGLQPDKVNLREAAKIPALGLSNKALEYNEDSKEGEAVLDSLGDIVQNAEVYAEPPFEDQLARSLIWPEAEKLYGHGNEIATVTVSHNSMLIATACRASSADFAVIRLYAVAGWREIGRPLAAHSLTITCLKFSPDDEYLLSTGRDRQWTIFRRKSGDQTEFEMHTLNNKAHARMILDAAWAPTTSSRIFATAGRDKVTKVWRLDDGNTSCCAVIRGDVAFTAVDLTILAQRRSLLLATGAEDGGVKFHMLAADSLEVFHSISLPYADSPSRQVNRLKYSTSDGDQQENDGSTKVLSICSDDCSMRIYCISFR